jgi:hypothetical protein
VSITASHVRLGCASFLCIILIGTDADAFPDGFPDHRWGTDYITFNIVDSLSRWGSPLGEPYKTAYRAIMAWDRSNVPGSRLRITDERFTTSVFDSTDVPPRFRDRSKLE